jgi:hypothetical protein
MAPIIAEVLLVLKKARKLGLAITSVITPASYPKRNDPVAAKAARLMVKSRPILLHSKRAILIDQEEAECTWGAKPVGRWGSKPSLYKI